MFTDHTMITIYCSILIIAGRLTVQTVAVIA